jgi:hypothetical protein
MRIMPFFPQPNQEPSDAVVRVTGVQAEVIAWGGAAGWDTHAQPQPGAVDRRPTISREGKRNEASMFRRRWRKAARRGRQRCKYLGPADLLPAESGRHRAICCGLAAKREC